MWDDVARAPRPTAAPASLERLDSARDRLLPDLAVRRPARPARASGSASTRAPPLLGHRRHDAAAARAGRGRARSSRGELDVALVIGAEALATQRRVQEAGRAATRTRSSRPRSAPFPWEAPFHPAEVAHEVFQAWLTFAVFDNARRGAPRASGSTSTARELGEHAGADDRGRGREPATRGSRSSARVDEIVTPTPDNRMVGYPYTKYMVSVMDVDMAAAVLLVASHERADALGVPRRSAGVPPGLVLRDRSRLRRRAPRPVALAGDGGRARRARCARAGVGIDDVAHLDLYSLLRLVGELRARRARASRRRRRGR